MNALHGTITVIYSIRFTNKNFVSRHNLAVTELTKYNSVDSNVTEFTVEGLPVNKSTCKIVTSNTTYISFNQYKSIFAKQSSTARCQQIPAVYISAHTL